MLDGAFLAALGPLAAWLVVSGVDDACLFLAWAWVSARGRTRAVEPEHLASEVESPLAVFVPLWQEDAVIGQMVTHNATAIRYSNYHFFIGAYPNDAATIDAIVELEGRFPNVHLALTPHDGPTSKADCLNWIYQTMLLYEERSGVRFAAAITHDAEDLIHPDSFQAINYHLREYDMVQVPVLPLATPVKEWVHGIYIDEFIENQVRDLAVRCRLGGFLPSAGVGTAFSRHALERLAESADNRVFEPACLTEDYENGFRVRVLGLRQILLPMQTAAGVRATREYFPRTFRAAARQRTRWVTGIVWQGLERHGWAGGWRQWWWHWRDRKGLPGNAVGILANAAFVYGACSWAADLVRGESWHLGGALLGSWVVAAIPFTLAMAALQAGARAALVGRVYGWRHGAASVIRIPLANWLNAAAGVRATWRYWRARARREPMVWLKTAHQYPNRYALEAHRPTLQEVLVGSHYCSREEVDAAIASKPAGMRLQDWLLELGQLTEGELYEALSLQLCVPLVGVEADEIQPRIARSLPAHLLRQWQVIPVRRQGGELLLAGPEIPPEEAQEVLRQYTRLEIRFALIPRSSYEALAREVIPLASTA